MAKSGKAKGDTGSAGPEEIGLSSGSKARQALQDGPEPFDLRSHTVTEDRKGELLRLFPEARTEGEKVDFNRLRLALGESVDVGKERYGLTWPGKADCFRAIQTPSLGTLLPAPAESVNWGSTENMIIEGDNLEVLKLLQKSYLGKVKMIYIDPPYNTGNDFIYPDDYAESLQTYLEFTGQVDSQGKKFSTNSDTEGRFHSKWLNMMYPRLFLARNLIAENGVIFVSIDDAELPTLRLIMNEVFGEEAFKDCIVIKRGAKSVQAQFDSIDSLASGHEYVLLYARTPSTRFRNFLFELNEKREGVWNNHWRGTERPTMRYELFGITPSSGQWRWSKERSLQAINHYELMLKELAISDETPPEDRVIDEWWEARRAKTGEELDLLRLSRSGKPEHYIAPTFTKVGSDLWTDVPSNGSAELKALFGKILFDNPKPVQLVRRMLDWITESRTGDVVLDFFAGSGTTAQAVLEANADDNGDRRFALVQLPEPTPEESEARKAGFLTISALCEERVRRAVKENGSTSGFRVLRLAESNFKVWDSTRPAHPDALQLRLVDYVHHIREGRSEQDILTELLLKSGFAPSTIISEVSVGGKKAYKVADGRFVVCLDRHLTLEAIRAIADLRPARVVCLDEGFEGNDQLKVNAAQTFKTKGVTSFQTV